MTTGCLLCEMEQAAPGAVVFRDELWAAEVAPGYEVPGWFFLRVRRRAELLTGLDDAELSALGHRARDLIAAVTDATAAPATYLLHFGENYRHFHALVAARGADIPAAQRGGNILGLRPGHIDRAAAVALVPSVRAAYERTARAPRTGAESLPGALTVRCGSSYARVSRPIRARGRRRPPTRARRRSSGPALELEVLGHAGDGRMPGVGLFTEAGMM